MSANGAVYIQEDDVDLADVFGRVRTDQGSPDAISSYEVNLHGDIVRFNRMHPHDVPGHIEQFLAYIASLEQDEQRKHDASSAIRHTQVVLGLVTDKEFADNHAIWQSLFQIADRYNGFVFVYGSILLPNGAVLVGPMLDE